MYPQFDNLSCVFSCLETRVCIFSLTIYYNHRQQLFLRRESPFSCEEINCFVPWLAAHLLTSLTSPNLIWPAADVGKIDKLTNLLNITWCWWWQNKPVIWCLQTHIMFNGCNWRLYFCVQCISSGKLIKWAFDRSYAAIRHPRWQWHMVRVRYW